MKTKDEMAHWSIYIKGVSFPQDKAELKEACRRNNAPQPFLDTIEDMPDKTYHTAADVGREIGRSRLR